MWRRKIPIAGVDRVYHDCRNRAHSGEARRPGLDTTKRFTHIPPCPSCAKSQAVKKARRLRGGRYGLDVGDITPGRATSQGSGHASASPAKQMMSLSCGDSLTTAPGTVLARSLFQTPMPAVSVLALVAVLYPLVQPATVRQRSDKLPRLHNIIWCTQMFAYLLQIFRQKSNPLLKWALPPHAVSITPTLVSGRPLTAQMGSLNNSDCGRRMLMLLQSEHVGSLSSVHRSFNDLSHESLTRHMQLGEAMLYGVNGFAL